MAEEIKGVRTVVYNNGKYKYIDDWSEFSDNTSDYVYVTVCKDSATNKYVYGEVLRGRFIKEENGLFIVESEEHGNVEDLHNEFWESVHNS